MFQEKCRTQVLDQFLILVQLLQGFSIHERQVVCLGFIAMLLVTQDADLHGWAGNMLEPKRKKDLLYPLHFSSHEDTSIPIQTITGHKMEKQMEKRQEPHFPPHIFFMVMTLGEGHRQIFLRSERIQLPNKVGLQK